MVILNDVEQGSDLWFKEKLAKPSASNASKIITNSGDPSKQRTGYLYELAAEAITGKREEGYTNSNIEEGKMREEESRGLYEFINNVKVDQVGVVYKDEDRKFLCSPDGIINGEYGLEMKNVLPKTQVKYLLDGGVPTEYFGQVQFSLYVTGFKFWDFFSYSPALRPHIVRCYPDEKYQKALSVELGKFCAELKEIIEKIK
jgi:hypothetical protein